MFIALTFLMMVGVGKASDLQTTTKQRNAIELKSFADHDVKEFRRMLKISDRLSEER